MRKIFPILFLILSIFSAAYSQEAAAKKIPDAEFQKLLTFLSKESWKESYELSSKYLDQLKNDDDAQAIGQIRYMLLYSAAGSVAAGALSYEELEKLLPKLVGKKIAVPYRRVAADCNGRPMFNFICQNKDTEYDVVTTAANRAATSILAFEYVKLAKKFDFDKNDNEQATILGTVEKIAPNSNRSTIFIVRIYINDAEIVLRSK